jgi:DNA-binding transcriptional LysR family regulator
VLRGVGLAYVSELMVAEAIRKRRLRIVLEGYAPRVPGLFLYYPSRAQSSSALRAFVETAKELLARRHAPE